MGNLPPSGENAVKKSFDNSCDNSYTKFVILEIKPRFTCGESNLYYNVALFHYIISTIAAFSLR